MGHPRHGYTNSTVGDGGFVVKCYAGPDAAARLATERIMLRRYRGRLPVPAVVRVGERSLTTRFVPGEHGQDLLDDGHAVEVLRAGGRLLRLVQSMPVRGGDVLVHGDFGPDNLLLDPVTFETAALVDWEWAHSGDPVEDLAWFEWAVRACHPEHRWALPEFFAAYGGAVPAWPRRQAAMLSRGGELLDFSARRDPGGEAEKHWLEHLDAIAGWTDLP